jgi:hypothetical protein
MNQRSFRFWSGATADSGFLFLGTIVPLFERCDRCLKSFFL